jgi:hypothetical protein
VTEAADYAISHAKVCRRIGVPAVRTHPGIQALLQGAVKFLGVLEV